MSHDNTTPRLSKVAHHYAMVGGRRSPKCNNPEMSPEAQAARIKAWRKPTKGRK